MSNLTDPRVLFAAERTLLAWNRTSLALIAFGFLVERSGLLLRLLSGAPAPAAPYSATLWLGAAFILLGVGASLQSSRQFKKVLLSLNPEEIPAGYSVRWGMLVNTVVALLGLALVMLMLVYHF